MDLTPLYELRERLKNSAIAGTALCTDDFRLKRAVENFASLAQAAPVFGKVNQLAQTALAPDCADRPGALLDALTLVDAVLCTQGSVSVAGQYESLPALSWGKAVTSVPYSVIAPLLDALQNSGGGRYSLIIDAHKAHPEYFEDHRIKAALVKALGASYAELADQAAAWLKEDSPAIVPLVKQGFDPKGRKEMVRRVEVIDALAKDAENNFYLTQLEDAEKDVKAALIYALRHNSANVDKLLSLVNSERGSLRDAAHWALVELDTTAVWGYWRTLAAKKPQEAGKFLTQVNDERACQIITQALLELLPPLVRHDPAVTLDKTAEKSLYYLINALPGKSGPAVCACYQAAADLGAQIAQAFHDRSHYFYSAILSFEIFSSPNQLSELVANALLRSLTERPDPQLTKLIAKLFAQYGDVYAEALLAAKFLSDSAAKCYQWVSTFLQKDQFSSYKAFQQRSNQIKHILKFIQWQEKQQTFLLRIYYADARTETSSFRDVALYEPLDEGFYDLLMDRDIRDDSSDHDLADWIQPHNHALCAKLGRYFYERALEIQHKHDRRYLSYLHRCGWSECEGLLINYCQGSTAIALYYYTSYLNDLAQFIDDMPGDSQAKVSEVKRLYQAVSREELPALALFDKKDFLENLQAIINKLEI